MKDSIILAREEFETRYNYKSATPMMKQYLDIKFAHQDCYLLFRLGDFFELFFEDAQEVSKILGIALAKRGKLEEEDIAMCGVPYHAIENYLPKLLETGVNIAICDQLETPEEAKKRAGHKAVVQRDVTRIITPGTIMEDQVLDSSRPNYLMSLAMDEKKIVISYADVSTGDFNLTSIDPKLLEAEISRIEPVEIIVSDSAFSGNNYIKAALKHYQKTLVFQPDIFFEFNRCSKAILDFYSLQNLHSLGELQKTEISAIGAVVQYLKITYKNNLPRLSVPRHISSSHYMILDSATRSSLEITSTIRGKRSGSLISSIDHTLTSSGSRLLYNFLSAPMNNFDAIIHRQNIVTFFVNQHDIRESIRSILKQSGDVERSLARIEARRCLPYDLLHIRNTLIDALKLREIFLGKFSVDEMPSEVFSIVTSLNYDQLLLQELCDSIKNEPANDLSGGGYINISYHPKLEELNNLINNSKEVINDLKIRYQKLTGLENLKIAHNNIIGLYAEVTNKYLHKIDKRIFDYKQSTSNTTRYTTHELQEIQSKIVNANSLQAALEAEIFEKICCLIDEHASKLHEIANNIARLDVFAALAELASRRNFVKPELNNENHTIIRGGFHPVVEEFLKKDGSLFIKNDLSFNEDCKTIILTGPNMGGKSTFLRQNAIITLLAQIGSFVPAISADIGIVDRIFCRVGSSDELSAGRSTFMVEMEECAAILNNATKDSLVILDEVGRGTATYDGMSVAWSIIEFLANQKACRTLFATHYHELVELSAKYRTIKNMHVYVEEKNEEMIFTHKVKMGAASKSYGIHVAEIAGLPSSVIKQAYKILKILEKERQNAPSIIFEDSNQSLFNIAKSSKNNTKTDKILDVIKQINLERTSPFEALQKLLELQNMAKDD